MAEREIRVGRRVWVRYSADPSGRSLGRIAFISKKLFTGDSAGFVVELNQGGAVVTCEEHRRGEQWDFAD